MSIKNFIVIWCDISFVCYVSVAGYLFESDEYGAVSYCYNVRIGCSVREESI